MIVRDKLITIKSANEISNKLIDILLEEVNKFICDDNPSEQIYLYAHIIGNLVARIIISLSGYGEIFNINGLDHESLLKWICIISRENININLKKEI